MAGPLLVVAAQAVAGVHEQRIVHSDLKPANFLLVEGQLKLIDFGIAKAIGGDTTSIARESQVGGSLQRQLGAGRACASGRGAGAGQQNRLYTPCLRVLGSISVPTSRGRHNVWAVWWMSVCLGHKASDHVCCGVAAGRDAQLHEP